RPHLGQVTGDLGGPVQFADEVLGTPGGASSHPSGTPPRGQTGRHQCKFCAATWCTDPLEITRPRGDTHPQTPIVTHSTHADEVLHTLRPRRSPNEAGLGRF